MDQANFYLASAAVLPVLAVVQVGQRIVPLRVPTPRDQTDVEGLLGHISRFGTAWSLVETALLVVAEVICLRQLQTGHAPLGGAPLVWAALAVLGINVAIKRIELTERDAQRAGQWAADAFVRGQGARRARKDASRADGEERKNDDSAGGS